MKKLKRQYRSPEIGWVPIRSSKAIADVCWAYAKNTQPFYYNTYGTGYAELYAVGGKCDKNVYFEVKYYPEDMSDDQKAIADKDMQRVIAQVIATMPQKPNNYKGSVFSPNVDPSWS
jgi:hypothetical protein